MVTKSGIRVESYVHDAKTGELIAFDDLTPEQKTKAATELKCRYINELFRGKGVTVRPMDEPAKG